MKSILCTIGVMAGLILSLFALYGCDARHTLVEAFFQNGAETKLIAYDASGNLGQSVAISGELALVGASSSAYIYRRDGSLWKKEANLTPSDRENDPRFDSPQERFGYAVALHGNIAVVGSPPDYGDSGSGSVYVYRLKGSSWQEEAKLTASDGTAAIGFGYAVSVNAEVIAVGNPSYPNSGFVYLYRFNGSRWVEEAKVMASAGAAEDGYGSNVSVNGNVLLVGASGAEVSAKRAGMAYVYRFNGSQWAEEARLVANDGAERDGFGAAIAISGEVAIIGAPYADAGSEDSGSAYVYRYEGSSWRQEAKLRFDGVSDPYTGSGFGSAVAIYGNVAIIGAPGYYEDSAYVYRWTGDFWYKQEKLAAKDWGTTAFFGSSVSINGSFAIVGAPSPFYGIPSAAFIYAIN